MKLRWGFFALVILLLALAACGGDGAGDSDEDIIKPVEDFFAAFEEMDAEKAADSVCKEYRDSVKTGLDMIFGFIALSGEDSKIEITGMKLEVKDKKDREAMVTATSGKIRITVLGEVQEEEIAESTEAVKLVKEDGKWLICDDSLAEGFAP